MKAVARTERRRVFRVDPDAWRDPAAPLDHEEVLLVGLRTATCASPTSLVLTALRHDAVRAAQESGAL